MVAASFIRQSASAVLLRTGEGAGATPAAGVHARRTAVDNGSPRLDIDHQPLAIHHIRSARQLDVADPPDQLVIEVVDSKIALRRFGGAGHAPTAGRIEPGDLHACAPAVLRS